FKGLGCSACHQGAMLGANMYQRTGVFHPVSPGGPATLRVPSLRNVAVTAPYFHDGRVDRLSGAVRIMGRAQLDRALSPAEVEQLVEFLKALTGRYRGRLLRQSRPLRG
ncbi:c-type cytochrome, partial [bacterium]